ncbi:hypothetical protein [Halosimplex salinum]|uniref:hypothetical protein n=1 Tax=Halosimplex salinum TaxID=1710538 RepID=UPI000F4866E1|nr:hypothetical protein [Halosimplex salinum]
MPSAEFQPTETDSDGDQPPVHCPACRSALQSDGGQTTSFLLLDRLTIPVLGCEDHLSEFTSVCDLTTEDTADLLGHLPAGGIQCPGCRNARYDAAHPMVPVHDGAVVVAACPEHQSAILQRFRTGLQTQQQLTADLGAADSPL